MIWRQNALQLRHMPRNCKIDKFHTDNVKLFYIINTVRCHQSNIKHSTNKCTLIINIIQILYIIIPVNQYNMLRSLSGIIIRDTLWQYKLHKLKPTI